MAIDPIRIRIQRRDGQPSSRNPRDDFWAPLRESSESSNNRISDFESRLCRQFGVELQNSLVHSVSRGLRDLESELFPGSTRDFERFFFRFMKPGPEFRAYQFAEVYSKYLDYRLQVVRENPALRDAQRRAVLASGITFATRIAGYSSLDLNVSVGSIERAAEVFDNNFDSFRVFLDAFVPVAFGEVFTDSFADQHQFEISVPSSLQTTFEKAVKVTTAVRDAISGDVVPDIKTAPTGAVTSRERAEWLWRLANGSLLVPVILALIVMYFGLKQVADMRSIQYEALKPILDHQLELLKEDRLRFPVTGRETTASDKDSRSGNAAPQKTSGAESSQQSRAASK